ncbi:hypothetical protein FRC07_008405, partial [Ceratobasidium sp. 392]
MSNAIRCMEKALLLTQNNGLKASYLANLGVLYLSLFERLGQPEYLEKTVWFYESAALLSSDGHPDYPEHLQRLCVIRLLVFKHLGKAEQLEKAICEAEQLLLLTPEGHPGRLARLCIIGQAYRFQSERSGRVDDIGRARIYLGNALMLTPDDHKDLPTLLSDLGNANYLLYRRLGRLEDLQKAVRYLQQASCLTPDGDESKHSQLSSLGIIYTVLFQRLGRLEYMELAVNCHEQAVLMISVGHKDKPSRLSSLGGAYLALFERLGRLGDIYKSIECQEKAVALTSGNHPDWPSYLERLGHSYGVLFKNVGRVEDMNKATSYLEQAVALTPDDHPPKLLRLVFLGQLSWILFNTSHEPRDLIKAMTIIRQAAYVPVGYPSDKLRAARLWAMIAAEIDLESELEAYARTMELLPQAAWLGVSVDHRYESLINVEFRVLGAGAATAAIKCQRFDLALEWLEQGRSIVWGQTLQLRAPFEELASVDPMMAEQFKQVSYELDQVSRHYSSRQTLSSDSEAEIGDAQRHRRLAIEWERLLDNVRLLPGLHGFLRPNASNLVDLVQDGTVVIVNVYFDRCDALILRAGAEITTHVPLSTFSFEKAETARNLLKTCLSARGVRRGIKRHTYNPTDTLRNILKELWFEVAKPVLDHLSINQVLPAESLPHITWCTTGPLSFLPLHAAGDYSNPSAVLPNLAVSSYIPTLSALRPAVSVSDTFSGILTVGQESSSHGLDSLPGTKAELDEIQSKSKGLPLTRLDGSAANADAVLEAMKTHSWVHFACHASQNSDDPMRSALHLHDQDLDLATITSQQLNNAQLAFLSACQTATGDAALPDEAVHLAAGLLFAGYPTVIATMWSIQDQDAPLVAGKVYEYLLKDGVPDSRQAARALHLAVTSLREKVGVEEFVRWVP